MLDQSRRRRRTSRSALAVVALLTITMAGALTGCGSGDDPKDDAAKPSSSPSPSATSATPSASPSPTETPITAPDRPEVPRLKNTPAGRMAFAKFVIDRWNFALRYNDGDAVGKLSPAKQQCDGCNDLEAELARRVRQKWYVDFPGATVKKVTLKPGTDPLVYVATAQISIPASTSYYTDGAYRNDNQARPKATFTVIMRRDLKDFKLLAFSVR